MDRLKVVIFIKSNPFIFHLHSSMDRLKGEGVSRKYGEFKHLHSSMDRLKDVSDRYSEELQKIYIPVWID